MSTFYVGQRVVCIDGDSDRGGGYGDEIYPCTGDIYTVRSISVRSQVDPQAGTVCVRLVEIKNPQRRYLGTDGNWEADFAVRRFRPIIERKTDITIFTQMLAPTSPQKVDA